MHEYLAAKKKSAENEPELFVGDVVQAGIDHGMRVEAVQVSDEPFLDIGTGEALVRAVRRSVGDQRTDFRGQKT